MALEQLEKKFQDVTSQERIPGAVLAATNTDGSFNYIKPFGRVSIQQNAASMQSNATFSIASSSKLITNVAAMQCIERGLLTLDTDIAKILPEWKSPQVLTGFDSDGKAVLEPARSPIIFSQLLSHNSGIAFPPSETLKQYYNSIGQAAKPDVIKRYFQADSFAAQQKILPELQSILYDLQVEPLVFQPGCGWVYGYGQEWAGQIIERLTGMSLDSYCQKYIFEPLEMSASFRYGEHPVLERNLVPMMMRQADGSLRDTPRFELAHPPRDLGGASAVCSAPDYLKLLASLMRNDGKLLKPESVDVMFNYRLPSQTKMDIEDAVLHGMVPGGTKIDHCLAGLVNLTALSNTGRSPGSISWSGSTGTFWWIDRAAGLCGFYGSAVMVANDQGTSRGLATEFERAIYQHASELHDG